MIRITGKATLTYDQPPRILEAASIVGQKEGDGPLSHLFDCIEPDPKFGKNTWVKMTTLAVISGKRQRAPCRKKH